MTIQQHFFTTVGVWWLRGEFVYFPPQRERSAIGRRDDGRRRVRVKSSMGRFFSGNSRSCGAIGDSRSIAAVSLFGQGCSGRRSGLAAGLSIRPMPVFSMRAPRQPGLGGEADTGFVTFAVYESDKGGKADAAPAKGVPGRLQSGHAGSRVVLDEMLKIRPSEKANGLDATRAKEPWSSPRDRSPRMNIHGADAGCVR